MMMLMIMELLMAMAVVFALFFVEGGVDSPQEVRILRTVAGLLGGDVFPWSLFVARAAVLVLVVLVVVIIVFHSRCL